MHPFKLDFHQSLIDSDSLLKIKIKNFTTSSTCWDMITFETLSNGGDNKILIPCQVTIHWSDSMGKINFPVKFICLASRATCMMID